jgi:hypothetical protein
LPPDVVEAAQKQVENMRSTELGKERGAKAEPQPYGAVKGTPEERAMKALVDLKAIPAEMTQAKFNEQVRIAQEVQVELDRAKAAGPYVHPRYTGRSILFGGPGEIFGEEVETYFRDIRGPMLLEFVRREEEREMGRRPRAEAPELDFPIAPVSIVNIGSQINAPDRFTAPQPGRLGVSAAAGSHYKTPLGGG